MIAVQLRGQLGNQLFQIAFIRTVAKQLKQNYIILDDTKYGNLVSKYFDLPWYNCKYIRKLLQQLRFFITQNVFEFNNWQSHNYILNSVKPNCLYNGFYQSTFLVDRNHFSIKSKFKKEFNKKYGLFLKNNKTIVMHIRLKDYFEFGNDKLGGKNLTLPQHYYYNALNKINTNFYDRICIISDDIDYVKKNFQFNHPVFYEENTMIIDFQLLMHADVLVLSNSSFSWWGAHQNEKENKIVYAPRYWLGYKIKKDYPIEIIKNDWILVDI